MLHRDLIHTNCRRATPLRHLTLMRSFHACHGVHALCCWKVYVKLCFNRIEECLLQRRDNTHAAYALNIAVAAKRKQPCAGTSKHATNDCRVSDHLNSFHTMRLMCHTHRPCKNSPSTCRIQLGKLLNCFHVLRHTKQCAPMTFPEQPSQRPPTHLSMHQ